MASSRVLSGEHFLNGDIACAEGALAAGCGFFGGYPITPSTEIAERLARRLNAVGGRFVQFEDELASIAAVLGAAWTGTRSMTATSGPGFSLMMENIGLGMMTETPCVVVNVMRGGPSTGLPTLVAQADVMQARWGSHGDYQVIAYAPASCQEMFDLTVKAFNAADRFRQPVFVLADEAVGHLTERLTIPEEEDIPRVGVKRPMQPAGNGFLPYKATDDDLVPPMPIAGQGYHLHVTGLTHDERGYPATDGVTHDRLVRRLNDKVRQHVDEIVEYEEYLLDDADVVVVAFGGLSRSARRAVRLAREQGIRAGLLRPITIWPFPEKAVAALDGRVSAFVCAELNLGQIALELRRHTSRPIRQVNHAGGVLLPPESILTAIREVTR